MDLNSPRDIVFFHGFLGRGSDWEAVTSRLQDPRWRLHCPDYTREPSLQAAKASLEEWGEAFHDWCAEKGLREVVLVGYSQGGRLALQAWKSRPDLVQGGVFLSVNPGLSDGDMDGRFERMRNDEAWAARFEQEPWSEVLKAWNAQAVFAGGGAEPERLEQDFSAAQAAACLRDWSLAKQKDARPFLVRMGHRSCWAAGEKDPKFAEMLRELKKECPKIEAEFIPNAGHRLLIDAPEAVAALIRSWLEAELDHRV